MNQSKFLDILNAIELPFIKLIQTICFAPYTKFFWNMVSKLGAPGKIRYLPLFLYCLGFHEKAYLLSLSFVYFGFFSSIGKHLIKRRRPGSYEGIFNPKNSTSSSFPSKHTICVSVAASYFPFTYLWIILVVMARINLGRHFISDCVVGVLIGRLSVYLAPMITNANFCVFVFLVTFRIWSGAYKIISGALPLILYRASYSSPLCLPLFYIYYLIRQHVVEKFKKQKENKEQKGDKQKAIEKAFRARVLIMELISITIMVFLINEFNQLLHLLQLTRFHNKGQTIVIETENVNQFVEFLMNYDFFKSFAYWLNLINLRAQELKLQYLHFLI